MLKTKHVVLWALCLWSVTQLFAQKKTELKTKFGKLSEVEMKMSAYDKDPDANAVILFDKAYLDYELNGLGRFDCQLKRHVRIKIFKKEGYQAADVQIPHPEYLKVFDLKASCHNLEDGKWVETKMKSESIFDETLNKWMKVKKFTIPQVREGSILEYSYTLFDDGGGYMPTHWQFQYNIPNLWSEYEVHIPEYYDFLVVARVDAPFWIEESRKEQGQGYYRNTRVAWFNQFHRWIQKDIPALKTEPMMTSKWNYQSRLTFQYKGFYQLMFDYVGDEIRINAGLFKHASNTWERLAESLMKDDDFGGVFENNSTKDLAQSITKGLTDKTAKVAAIYEYIGKNYETASYPAYYLRQPFKELLKTHKGASAELNILAINLLRAVGVEAYPVLISTRSNGHLNPYFPMRDRIDRMIIGLPNLETGQDLFFADMGGFPMPLGLMPFENLNGQGFMIKNKDVSQWVTIKNKLNNKLVLFNNLALDDKGVLSGTMVQTSTGYEAYKNRYSIEKEGVDKYAQLLLKDLLVEGKLLEQKVENASKLDEKPLKGTFKIQTTAFVTKTDSQIYLSPMLFWTEKDNLFKNPERKYDVDFGYTREHNYILNLTIPNGYKVESLPKNEKITFEDNSFIFTYVSEVVDKQVKCIVKWSIKKPVFEVAEYPFLSKAYETVLAKMAEQIVFSKI